MTRCQSPSVQSPTRTFSFSSPIRDIHLFISSASGNFGRCALASIIARLATILPRVSNGSGSEVMRTMTRLPANNALQRNVIHRGHPALALDCALAGVEWASCPSAELGR